MTDTTVCNSYERWNMDIHNLLCQALHQTLIRLCCTTEHTTIEELYNIAQESISYPNNGVVAYPEGLGQTHLQAKLGKPQDIELRVALKLYHRFKQKRKLPVVVQPSTPEDPQTLVNGCINHKKTTAKKPYHAIYVMRTRSDMGILREFTSERHVADVIVKTLEELIVEESWAIPSCKDHPRPPDYVPYQGRPWDDSCSSVSLRNIVSDIRVDQSGIIYIITKAREQQLRSIGRLPCSLCTKWCKGEKGLWWHQQQEHGRYHSEAITQAKLQIDHLAIVPYVNPLRNDATNSSLPFHCQQKHPLLTSHGDGTTTIKLPTCSRENNILSAKTEQPLLDYMEPIKAGDIQRVQLIIEVNKKRNCFIDSHCSRVCEMWN